MNNRQRWFVLCVLAFAVLFGSSIGKLIAQMQQSGGPGANVNATQSGTWTVQPGNTANTTAWKVDGSAVTQPVSGTFWQATQPVSGTVSVNALPTGSNVIGHAIIDSGSTTAVTSLPALPAGTNNVGLVRILPSSCSQSTPFQSATAQVGTGAGTSVTSTTTCVTFAYANNITNSAVTFRLADKQGTPVIWFGGNGDFSIPANSNVRIPIDGVTFTSGITAIAGTSSAINLEINGVQ
jgi:hypothetical protein